MIKEAIALLVKNNNLSDITELSNLHNLVVLSLEGNENIKGTISNDNLSNLDLRNCNISNDFDFSKMKKLSFIN